MSPDATERGAPRPLDPAALERVWRRLQRSVQPPWLHGEVARRMAGRLDLIRLRPIAVLDWWAHVGGSGDVLARACPRARRIEVERPATASDGPPGAPPRPWWHPGRWTGGQALGLADDAVPAGSAQLLWSNMGLHFAVDPQAVMRRWHAALQVDGFLMFSTLGPGTLEQLRLVYAEQGWPAPHAPFVDMHDLGDMLVEAGFGDPVMDQETLTLTWPTPQALLAELRALGGNLGPHRVAGLRTPRWRERLCAALAARADAQGRIALDFEVVYGHAFRPPPRWRASGQTQVSLEDLRATVRTRRRAAASASRMAAGPGGVGA